jgi:hypothetical protein
VAGGWQQVTAHTHARVGVHLWQHLHSCIRGGPTISTATPAITCGTVVVLTSWEYKVQRLLLPNSPSGNVVKMIGHCGLLTAFTTHCVVRCQTLNVVWG